MNANMCQTHNQIGESFNEKGYVICRYCLLQQNEDVNEYKTKKLTILKKQQEQMLERLRISKKRMIEVQETLLKNMEMQIVSLDSYRQNILSYFAQQEQKIENFQNQQQDYQAYMNNNKLVTNQDSQSKQVVILGERIQVLEEEFQKLLEQSISLYTGFVYQKQSNVQKGEEKQVQIQQQDIQEQFQYKKFHVFQKVNLEDGIMQINKNNNMIAFSESFEITILTFENQLVQFDVDKIEEEDMALILCLKFGNTNDDLYFGTNNGIIRIWRKVDQKWEELHKLDSKQVEILDLLLNSNDTSLFTAGKDKSVQLRKKNELGEWILKRSFNHQDIGNLTSIAINLNETTLVVSSFAQIKIWKLDNNSDQFQIIGDIQFDMHNVIQFINNNLFYLHSPLAHKFYLINDETHFKLTQNLLPDEHKNTNLISYCQQKSLMIIQNKNKNVFTLKYNDATQVFEQQNQIEGEYDSIQIAQNAQYLLLYKNNEQTLHLLIRN